MGTGVALPPTPRRTLMLLIEVTDDHDLLTAAEIERALEVANNWGGWSFEEAELMARALQQTSGQSIVLVRVDDAGDGGGADG